HEPVLKWVWRAIGPERCSPEWAVHNCSVHTHGAHDEPTRNGGHGVRAGQNVVGRIAGELRCRWGGGVGDNLVFTGAPLSRVAIASTAIALVLERRCNVPTPSGEIRAGGDAGQIVLAVALLRLAVLYL